MPPEGTVPDEPTTNRRDALPDALPALLSVRRTVPALAMALLVVLAGCGGAMSGSDGADAGGDGGVGGAGDAASAGGSGQVGYAVGGAKDVNNYRNNVEEGYLPLQTDVTSEGLFYDYYFDTGKQERCTDLFCPSYSTAVSEDPLSNETERYVTVGLNSNIAKEDLERKRLNLVVVVDTSSSMGSGFRSYYYDENGTKVQTEQTRKMAAARQAIGSLTDQLRPEDRLGVVAYDSDARTVLPMARVGERDAADRRRQITDLQAGGGTNLAAGMREARTMARDAAAGANASEVETRVIYLTDAMPNEGTLSTEGLTGQLQTDADAGVYSTFVGVGIDFNSELVEAITDVEGANYYSVKSATSFDQRMDEEFKYMVTPLVFDLTLRFQSDDYRIAKVYGDPSADPETGRIMHVNTLFPAPTENGSTKGGVILLQLERTGEDPDPATLRVTYEDRRGVDHESIRQVEFESRDAPYYENSGVRKAVVLSRYADLVKNWIAYERAVVNDGQADDPGEGIEPHAGDGSLGRWERQSTALQVSSVYRERFAAFATYYAAEMEALGDESMSQELELLWKLAGEESTEGDPDGADDAESDLTRPAVAP